jgi:hypothetical protein
MPRKKKTDETPAEKTDGRQEVAKRNEKKAKDREKRKKEALKRKKERLARRDKERKESNE